MMHLKKPAAQMVISENEVRFYHNNMEDIFDQIKNANYETQVGDYKLKVDYVTPRIGIRPRVNPKIEDGKLDFKWSGNVRAQLDLLNMEMSRTQQNGAWTETQGIRGKRQDSR